MSRDCVFCAIARGADTAEIVGENQRALAFMDLNPATDGHVLVIPRAHADDIWTLDETDGRGIWSLAQQIAGRVRSALHPDGLTLFQANGTAGWQHVFHFHLHLVPRWVGDGLTQPWRSTDARRARIPEIAARLRGSDR
jgi:histidine triad (HIT) family protein